MAHVPITFTGEKILDQGKASAASDEDDDEGSGLKPKALNRTKHGKKKSLSAVITQSELQQITGKADKPVAKEKAPREPLTKSSDASDEAEDDDANSGKPRRLSGKRRLSKRNLRSSSDQKISTKDPAKLDSDTSKEEAGTNGDVKGKDEKPDKPSDVKPAETADKPVSAGATAGGVKLPAPVGGFQLKKAPASTKDESKNNAASPAAVKPPPRVKPEAAAAVGVTSPKEIKADAPGKAPEGAGAAKVAAEVKAGSPPKPAAKSAPPKQELDATKTSPKPENAIASPKPESAVSSPKGGQVAAPGKGGDDAKKPPPPARNPATIGKSLASSPTAPESPKESPSSNTKPANESEKSDEPKKPPPPARKFANLGGAAAKDTASPQEISKEPPPSPSSSSPKTGSPSPSTDTKPSNDSEKAPESPAAAKNKLSAFQPKPPPAVASSTAPASAASSTFAAQARGRMSLPAALEKAPDDAPKGKSVAGQDAAKPPAKPAAKAEAKSSPFDKRKSMPEPGSLKSPDTKPAETKPKPADTKPAEKPVESKPVETITASATTTTASAEPKTAEAKSGLRSSGETQRPAAVSALKGSTETIEAARASIDPKARLRDISRVSTLDKRSDSPVPAAGERLALQAKAALPKAAATKPVDASVMAIGETKSTDSTKVEVKPVGDTKPTSAEKPIETKSELKKSGEVKSELKKSGEVKSALSVSTDTIEAARAHIDTKATLREESKVSIVDRRSDTPVGDRPELPAGGRVALLGKAAATAKAGAAGLDAPKEEGAAKAAESPKKEQASPATPKRDIPKPDDKPKDGIKLPAFGKAPPAKLFAKAPAAEAPKAAGAKPDSPKVDDASAKSPKLDAAKPEEGTDAPKSASEEDSGAKSPEKEKPAVGLLAKAIAEGGGAKQPAKPQVGPKPKIDVTVLKTKAVDDTAISAKPAADSSAAKSEPKPIPGKIAPKLAQAAAGSGGTVSKSAPNVKIQVGPGIADLKAKVATVQIQPQPQTSAPAEEKPAPKAASMLELGDRPKAAGAGGAGKGAIAGKLNSLLAVGGGSLPMGGMMGGPRPPKPKVTIVDPAGEGETEGGGAGSSSSGASSSSTAVARPMEVDQSPDSLYHPTKNRARKSTKVRRPQQRSAAQRKSGAPRTTTTTTTTSSADQTET